MMEIDTMIDYMIDILTAMKEGKKIQHRKENTKIWIDHDENILPSFDTYEYRIKPEVKSYRIAIMNSDSNSRYPIIVHTEETGIQIQSDYNFICWHTDWMDY